IQSGRADALCPQCRQHVVLEQIGRLAQGRFHAPRLPIPLRPLESMSFRPVDAEVDRRIGRVAVLIQPTAQEFALQNPAAWIHPRIPQELDVEEYLPRIPTLGDLDQLAAYVGRSLIEKPVQVLVFYQRVREQENEVVCS